MPADHDNEYVALSTASATSIDVQVSNGDLVDANGNSIYIGTQPTGDEAHRDIEALYVTRVKGATPTGNLRVVDGVLNVDGYGDVTLTDPTGKRAVDTVGGADGNDGDVQTDSGGSLLLEYTTTTTDKIKKSTVATQASDLPITVTADPPSDATDVFSSAAVKTEPSASTSDCNEILAEFSTDGDNTTVEHEERVEDCGGNNWNTDYRLTNQDTQAKKVRASEYTDNVDSTTFKRSTVAVVWDETTTTTETTTISVF